MTVRLLTLCTGNICRSPYAQLMLSRRLDDIRPGSFEVSSAGTQAMEGYPADPDTVRCLEAHGVTSDAFVARQLSEPMLGEIDVILALERHHRQTALSYSARHVKRAYTLVEFADLLRQGAQAAPWTEKLPSDLHARWEALPQHLARERARRHVAEAEDGIPDPYRRSPEVFDAMAAQVDAAIDAIVDFERSFV